tara:strand:+ start:190 stop:549 length:360 start_codon:yes stop_codon:yes gene_type:complete
MDSNTGMTATYNEIPKIAPKVYYSDIVGTPILDAITGAKYPYYVGSKDEERFFKVRSTVAYRSKNAKNMDTGNASESNQAFYVNPIAYMEHQGADLSEDIKDKWLLKTINYSKSDVSEI